MIDKEVILITGANGNIAKRIVSKYLDLGCIVIATDIHESSTISGFENNENYKYHKLDVTSIEDIENLSKIIEEKYGKISHIISGAGAPSKSEIENGIESVTIEDINKCINLNLIRSYIYHQAPFASIGKGNRKQIYYLHIFN